MDYTTCDLCKEKFTSLTQHFEHNLSWAHLAKSYAEDSMQRSETAQVTQQPPPLIGMYNNTHHRNQHFIRPRHYEPRGHYHNGCAAPLRIPYHPYRNWSNNNRFFPRDHHVFPVNQQLRCISQPRPRREQDFIRTVPGYPDIRPYPQSNQQTHQSVTEPLSSFRPPDVVVIEDNVDNSSSNTPRLTNTNNVSLKGNSKNCGVTAPPSIETNSEPRSSSVTSKETTSVPKSSRGCNLTSHRTNNEPKSCCITSLPDKRITCESTSGKGRDVTSKETDSESMKRKVTSQPEKNITSEPGSTKGNSIALQPSKGTYNSGPNNGEGNSTNKEPSSTNKEPSTTNITSQPSIGSNGKINISSKGTIGEPMSSMGTTTSGLSIAPQPSKGTNSEPMSSTGSNITSQMTTSKPKSSKSSSIAPQPSKGTNSDPMSSMGSNITSTSAPKSSSSITAHPSKETIGELGSHSLPEIELYGSRPNGSSTSLPATKTVASTWSSTGLMFYPENPVQPCAALPKLPIYISTTGLCITHSPPKDTVPASKDLQKHKFPSGISTSSELSTSRYTHSLSSRVISVDTVAEHTGEKLSSPTSGTCSDSLEKGRESGSEEESNSQEIHGDVPSSTEAGNTPEHISRESVNSTQTVSWRKRSRTGDEFAEEGNEPSAKKMNMLLKESKDLPCTTKMMEEINSLNEKEKRMQAELFIIHSQLERLASKADVVSKILKEREEEESLLQKRQMKITNEMSALLGKKQKILGGVDMNVELLDQLSEHSSREQSLQRQLASLGQILSGVSSTVHSLQEERSKMQEEQTRVAEKASAIISGAYHDIYRLKNLCLRPKLSAIKSPKHPKTDFKNSDPDLCGEKGEIMGKVYAKKLQVPPPPPLTTLSPLPSLPSPSPSSSSSSSDGTSIFSLSSSPHAMKPLLSNSVITDFSINVTRMNNTPTSNSLDVVISGTRREKLTTSSSRSFDLGSNALNCYNTSNCDNTEMLGDNSPERSQSTSGAYNSDVNAGQLASSVCLPLHTSSVLGLKVFENVIFSCSIDGTLKMHDLRSMTTICTLDKYKRVATSLELYVSSKGVYLISASGDKMLSLYNIGKRTKCATFEMGVCATCLCVYGDILFAGLKNGSVILIDIPSKRYLGKHLCHKDNVAVSCMCVLKNILCAASFDMTLVCWELQTSSKTASPFVFKQTNLLHFNGIILCLKLHEGKLYVACADRNLYIYSVTSWKQLHVIPHREAVSCLVIVGEILITSCFDRYLRCFDLKTLELVQAYCSYPDKIFALTVANKTAYTGMRNGHIGATKLDFNVFYTCKWDGCQLRFGLLDHLSNFHINEHAAASEKALARCRWKDCSKEILSNEMIEHLKKHTENEYSQNNFLKQ